MIGSFEVSSNIDILYSSEVDSVFFFHNYSIILNSISYFLWINMEMVQKIFLKILTCEYVYCSI